MAYTTNSWRTKDSFVGFRQNGTTVGTTAMSQIVIRRTFAKGIEIVPCHLVYVLYSVPSVKPECLKSLSKDLITM